MKPSLSALIIAKNEERDLPGCLESLKGLADEIVVLVDDATADRTGELARAAGCKVALRAFDNYAAQRQAALALCTEDWVLWIDCDERLSAELRSSLAKVSGDAAAYDLPFEVRFLGRVLRFGGLGGEHHVRLFRRGKARFVGGELHEGLAIDGLVDALPGAGSVLHEPYKDIADYLSKLDRYTSLGAQKKLAAGQRFRPWHHLLLPWEFLSGALLKLGFLDGFPGVVWAGLGAFYTWLKYVKLKELQERK
ncbi:MAG: glycosyltransferase family 2 protein [Elusimicrobia bacterium]|nr:glycosyltransferase family 2 protein [Elusimicrobiota bacterium]